MNKTNRLSADELRDALREADMRVLLMVLVHMTGDPAWLKPPYRPARDVRLIPDPSAGLPPFVQDAIRDAAARVLARGDRPAISDPDDALMRRMMSVCLGEEVAPEYAPLNREEMGLIDRTVAWSNVSADKRRGVLIVGAGVCGIALAVSLDKLGIPFTIVEKNASAGGTWFRNRYPGCGVDTPNHSYSYSFGPKHRWPRYFSRREDVLDYLESVVAAYRLERHIRFETELVGSRWDAQEQCWVSTLRCAAELEVFKSPFLVSAIGQLSDPAMPSIPGANTFQGRIFHSVDWQDDLDWVGKDIAVIGTGATAMQLVPTIAGRAGDIAVYQRTPQWARPIPGYSEPIGEGAQKLLESVPFYTEWFRFNMFWRYGDGLLKYLRMDPGWAYPERSVNAVNDKHRAEMTKFIHAELEGRDDLVAKCVPTYPPYGKRILLDNGWYKTLRRPNVDLVADGIECIGPDYVQTVDGTRRHADIVVYSTGFKLTEMAARLNIVGSAGRSLADEWRNDDPFAYLGLVVPRFPNFFCMLGPGSGPAHGGSAVFQAECQTRYITSCLVQMSESSIGAAEIRQDVCDDYLAKFDAEHQTLIWSHPGMSTYYRNSRGRVFSVMPWRFVDYWRLTHDADLRSFLTVPLKAEVCR